jgi:CMP/dCMP kinase
VRRLVIAIDGPAGAGKSTVSRRLAQTLGYRLLDTGAMYRAVALLARRTGVSWDDAAGCAAIAAALEVDFKMDGDLNRVFVDGEDVSAAIRTPEMSQGASKVSALPEVRAALLDAQRRLGGEGGVIAEGRDIGTVVFPHADVKVYLDASAEERARRRANDSAHTSSQAGQAAVAEAIAARDKSDTTRAASPLTLAADAVRIDTTELPVDVVVARVMELVEEKLTASEKFKLKS